MNEEILKQLLTNSSEFIDKLATKLGTTGEYVFQALVKYQVISGIATLIAFLVFFIGLVFGALKIMKISANGKRTGYWNELENKEVSQIVVICILITAGFVATLIMQRTLPQIFAPEYSAIDFIISSIK